MESTIGSISHPSEESLSSSPAVMVSSGISRNGGRHTKLVNAWILYPWEFIIIISMEIAIEENNDFKLFSILNTPGPIAVRFYKNIQVAFVFKCKFEYKGQSIQRSVCPLKMVRLWNT